MRLEFHLARELGMTRAELLERMSAQEFAQWVAFLQLEAREREQAQRRAKNRANARNLSLAASKGS